MNNSMNSDALLGEQFNELHRNIYDCELCSLACDRTQVVVKRGSNNSKIMLVGEAPGYYEDVSGIPFVGDSGALLENIFKSVGLDSEKIYITNIVKCRPPENRKPTNEEIKFCKTWLLQQLELIKPQILILLGATTYTGLFGNRWIDKTPFGITKHRGNWFNSHYCTNTICTFHPSYLLRNHSLDEGSPKYLVWKDFIEIKSKFDIINSVQEEIK